MTREAATTCATETALESVVVKRRALFVDRLLKDHHVGALV